MAKANFEKYRKAVDGLVRAWLEDNDIPADAAMSAADACRIELNTKSHVPTLVMEFPMWVHVKSETDKGE